LTRSFFEGAVMISFARFSVQVGVADAQKTKIARDIDSLNAIGACGVALAW
jgi:hypothetical protein